MILKESKIKIVFTDSGLGGLSIVADVYEKLRLLKIQIPVELIFSNALPETGKGYNRIPDMSRRIEIFNNVLNGIEKHFQPNLISIACNTLSVLAPKTNYYEHNHKKIIDIVNTGINTISSNNIADQNAYVIVFGTETTIQSDLHRQMLAKIGFLRNQIFTQDCPYLATEIELDYQSDKTKNIISESVSNVIRQLHNKNAKFLIYFACTHYGYVSDYFLDSFENNGFSNCKIINPNQSMVEYIINYINNLSSNIRVISNDLIKLRIVSRCIILPEEVQSISELVFPLSNGTVKALENYELKENLFNIL